MLKILKNIKVKEFDLPTLKSLLCSIHAVVGLIVCGHFGHK